MGTIDVVGLGAGDLKQLPLGIYERLSEARDIWLRTGHHPVVTELEHRGMGMHSFDEVYDRHHRYEDVYEEISETLIRLSAEKETPVVYAVPGHPLVAERSVQLLLQAEEKGRVNLNIMGGQSFLDPLFSALRIDPVEGVSVLDGTVLETRQLSPYLHTVISQVYDRQVASDVKLTLMDMLPDDYPVTVATAVGTEDRESIRKLALYELDHDFHPDHLTLVYVPPTEDETVLQRRFEHLKSIVSILRSPDGCPWDREQTHHSIRKNLIEETYEVLETIDEEDPEAMCEELGDLLLQVMLHAQMASEDGYFHADDVVAVLAEKLVRRHPHVFGEKRADDAASAAMSWEEIKAQEKKHQPDASALSGIPKDLPAVLYAWKLQKKAAKVGFDWDRAHEVFAKVEEEVRETKEAESREESRKEIGDLLFAIVNLARFYDVDPEAALMGTNRKFKKRFAHIERKLRENGKSFTKTPLKVLEEWWQDAKKYE